MLDAMARPLVLDGRNLYDPDDMAGMGFEYVSVGRPARPVRPAT
jgi:UDPglucose 6-dehydrogenase